MPPLPMPERAFTGKSPGRSENVDAVTLLIDKRSIPATEQALLHGRLITRFTAQRFRSLRSIGSLQSGAAHSAGPVPQFPSRLLTHPFPVPAFLAER